MSSRPIALLACSSALLLGGCAHSVKPTVLIYGALPAEAHWTYSLSPADRQEADMGLGQCLQNGARGANPGSDYLVEVGHTIRTGRTKVIAEATDDLQPDNPLAAKRVQEIKSKRPIEVLSLSISRAATDRTIFRATTLETYRPKPRKAEEPLAATLCRALRETPRH